MLNRVQLWLMHPISYMVEQKLLHCNCWIVHKPVWKNVVSEPCMNCRVLGAESCNILAASCPVNGAQLWLLIGSCWIVHLKLLNRKCWSAHDYNNCSCWMVHAYRCCIMTVASCKPSIHSENYCAQVHVFNENGYGNIAAHKHTHTLLLKAFETLEVVVAITEYTGRASMNLCLTVVPSWYSAHQKIMWHWHFLAT